MLGSKLMLCGACRLAFYPEKKKKGAPAAVCPACHAPARHVPELFQIGFLVVAVGLAAGAVQLAVQRGPAISVAPRFAAAMAPQTTATPARAAERERPSKQHPPPASPRKARVKANLVAQVASGPKRGNTISLKRGEKVNVLKKEGSKLLVQDSRGHQLYVKEDQLTTL